MSRREQFEAWVMTEICISKSTLEGLRTEDGYRNSTLSGTDYNRMWNCWQAASKASEQQLAAVVAENAGLKDITAWCHTEAFSNMHREFKTAEALGCCNEDCMHDAMLTALMHAPKTPATDACLAEVRAQGADEVAATCRLLADKDGCSVNMRCSYNLTAERAEAIAAQLRQGAEQ